MKRCWERQLRLRRTVAACWGALLLRGVIHGDTVLSLGDADLKLHGAAAGEEISDAKAAGDLNADGFSDLIVGSELAKVGGVAAAGRAFLVYGGPTLPRVIDLAALGSRGVTIENPAAGHDDHLGHAVADAGDLNGDGIDDVMVSAPRAVPPGCGSAGAVYVVFGGASLPGTLDLSTLGSRGVTILGARSGDLTGNAISRAGDLNGDGIGDIVIGAENADPGGRGNAGAAYVIFGSPSLPAVIDLAAGLGSLGVVFRGAREDDEFGAAVANLGDFNRDGIDDLLVSASLADPDDDGDEDEDDDGQEDEDGDDERAGAGKVHVIFGSRSFPPVVEIRSLGMGGVAILGPRAGDNVGLAVSCAGDFNHDGAPDALIGSDRANPGGRTSSGTTFVVFGGSAVPSTVDLADLGAQGVPIHGVGSGDRSGHSVHCVGDFNQDGIGDVVIGADKAQPHALGNAGQSYIVFGRTSPPSPLALGSLGAGGVYLDGEKAGDRSGHAVGDAGDVNGDAGPDVAVVARQASPLGRHRAGTVYVIFGKRLPAVEGLACRVSGENAVSLSWTLGGIYDSIRVDRDGAAIAVLAGTATSFSDPTPPFGVVVYEVFGVRGGKPSLPARCEVSVQVRPPFGLTCLAAGGVVHLSWQHAQPVDETRIFRDGDLIATLPGSPLAHQDPSAPVGEHEYRVVGVIGPHQSPPAVCRSTVPAPVTGLVCAANGCQVTLVWTLGQPGATGIRVLRDGGEIAIVGGGSTSYVDHEVATGSHLYRVETLAGEHSSAPAECTARVLPPVEGLAGSSDSGDVALAFRPPAGYELIQVFRDGIRIATLEGAATSYLDPDLEPGTYLYRVVGIAPGTVSKPAEVVVEVPAAVEDLACSADGDEATVSWTHGGPCDSIEVFRDGVLVANLSPAAESYLDALPGPGVFTYRVVCVRGNGRSRPAECVLKSPAPVRDLSCALIAGRFGLSWTLGGVYDSIEVIVNGEVRPLLPGDATHAAYDLGVCGAARGEVRGVCARSRSLPERCEAEEAGAPSGFTCLAVGASVHLAWENGGLYEAIRVERDGLTIATLPGDAVSHDDAVPAPGSYEYRVFGGALGTETLPAICRVLVNEAAADLRCSTDGETVLLSWTPAGDHHAVVIERQGSVYATLPAGTSRFVDPEPLAGPTTYGVRFSHLGSVGLLATCGVEILLPPADLACRAEGHTVRLSWSNPTAYTTIILRRNGVEVSPPGGLPGGASSFEDGPVSPGLYAYEVEGRSGAAATSAPARCTVEAILFPIRFTCSAFDGEACLRWVNPRAYDAIEVLVGGQVIATLAGGATSYCQDNLPPGEVAYEVRGIVGGSVSDSAACRVVVPESPTALECSQEGTLIHLRFTPPAGADAVLVHRDGGLLSVVPGTTGRFTDTDVPLGTHTYELRAGVGGDFSNPATCAVAMIAPPLGLACTSDGSSVRLCWTPGAAYKHVNIRRNGELLTPQGLPGGETCFTDPELSPGAYIYLVVGSLGTNRSDAAACSVVLIGRPFALACSIDGAGAALSWSNGAPYEEVEVQRRRPSEGQFSTIATLPGSASSYLDGPLTELGEYAYAVVGKLGGARSAAAVCTSARLRPPSNLVCTVADATVNFASVRLSWTNGEAFDAVVIHRNGVLLAALAGSATSYLDRDLGAGTYDYLVRGERGGDVSDPARCTVRVLLVPPPISGFTCRIDGTTARLSWTAERPADETRIYRRAPGEAQATLLASLPDTPASFSDPTATAAGEYRYEVAVVKDGVESSRALCDVRRPRAPSDLRCVPAGLGLTDGDVRLTWTPNEAYDGIIVLRGGVEVAVLPGNAAVFVDPDLPIGVYVYRLIGVLAGSRSSPSDECRVEVPADPPEVTGLACRIQNGTAELRWEIGAVYDSIVVERQGPGEGTPRTIATLSGEAETYTDRGLSGPGTYLYLVSGKIGARSSDPARCSTVLPAPPRVDPASCAAILGGSEATDVLITWASAEEYDSIIVIRITVGSQETVAVSLRGDQTAFLDQNVADGKYQYVIEGVIGGSSTPAVAACNVEVIRPSFIRGEANQDRRLDVADSVYIFNYLFLSQARPGCFDAADANDDGQLDIADGIWVIFWQFHGGAPPSPPFPTCGKDLTDDDLGCLSFPECL